MADETERDDDEATDGLEEINSPDLLKLLLRRERAEYAAEVAQSKADAEAREHALRRRRGEAAPPSGTITQGDLTAAPLDRRMELHRKIASGELKLVPGPKTKPRPLYSITREEITRLPLDERVRVQQEVLAGKALLIG